MTLPSTSGTRMRSSLSINSIAWTWVAMHPPYTKPLFIPEGANVGAAQILDEQTPRLGGLGATRACGTGACVAAYAALKRDLVTSKKTPFIVRAGGWTQKFWTAIGSV